MADESRVKETNMQLQCSECGEWYDASLPPKERKHFGSCSRQVKAIDEELIDKLRNLPDDAWPSEEYEDHFEIVPPDYTEAVESGNVDADALTFDPKEM